MSNLPEPEIRQALSHILWTGDATDTGKTSIAKMIAHRHGLQLYHYDANDAAQIERLAQTLPLLAGPHAAVWLIPTEEFKIVPMARRNKPSFKNIIRGYLSLIKC
jgi:hypothetical protein